MLRVRTDGIRKKATESFWAMTRTINKGGEFLNAAVKRRNHLHYWKYRRREMYLRRCWFLSTFWAKSLLACPYLPCSPSDLNTGNIIEGQTGCQAGADHCALCSISCVTSTLASVYCLCYHKFVNSSSLLTGLYCTLILLQSECHGRIGGPGSFLVDLRPFEILLWAGTTCFKFSILFFFLVVQRKSGYRMIWIISW